jgi:dTDP-4-dehydrorhamnose 3,5-epimerase
MKIIPTELDSVILIEPAFYRDERGFFLESYHRRRFEEHGLICDFVQDNHSRSVQHVLRGIHYQDLRAPMAKLVRCTVGSIWDVAVDLRVGSPSFGRWVAVELSAENMRQLLVPVGFGHGFLTLSESAEVQYKCSGYYTPEAEGSIIWNDAEVGIRWPCLEPILSKRDRQATGIREYLTDPAFRY